MEKDLTVRSRCRGCTGTARPPRGGMSASSASCCCSNAMLAPTLPSLFLSKRCPCAAVATQRICRRLQHQSHTYVKHRRECPESTRMEKAAAKRQRSIALATGLSRLATASAPSSMQTSNPPLPRGFTITMNAFSSSTTRTACLRSYCTSWRHEKPGRVPPKHAAFCSRSPAPPPPTAASRGWHCATKDHASEDSSESAEARGYGDIVLISRRTSTTMLERITHGLDGTAERSIPAPQTQTTSYPHPPLPEHRKKGNKMTPLREATSPKTHTQEIGLKEEDFAAERASIEEGGREENGRNSPNIPL
ncbi:hypothetical protein M409DRAFT_53135 [Zasmidium cellare ATCC 36951]|uniref:Uncharacterized protein n=1 Tax=Zasmidium cellare ATCC 36951 TaxID=1080233 RepID=A0A6A6CN42_ZASCE|nr:uncharacterized protein M409DRAFT_53135 [Zasmidium cellare ATCC 36951]KAF2168461.1 hypothetical protein M409DRAFT_53135 [Zasmidium cellare ATCC 36951]